MKKIKLKIRSGVKAGDRPKAILQPLYGIASPSIHALYGIWVPVSSEG